MSGWTGEIVERGEVLLAICERIRASRHASLQAVHRETCDLHWDIGELMERAVEGGEKAAHVTGAMSEALSGEFPGLLGFSQANLWSMLRYYREYRDHPELRALSREAGWAHNVLITSRCKCPLERAWYLKQTVRMGWSRNELEERLRLRAHLEGEPEIGERATRERRRRHSLQYSRLLTTSGADVSRAESLEIALSLIADLGSAWTVAGVGVVVGDGEGRASIPLLLYHVGLRRLTAVERTEEPNLHAHYRGKMGSMLRGLCGSGLREGEGWPVGLTVRSGRAKLMVEYWWRPDGRAEEPYRSTPTAPVWLAASLPSAEDVASLFSATAREGATRLVTERPKRRGQRSADVGLGGE
ncbi:MAG: DUF1016 N-terminal domain-containing protein [Phycisphaerales bacterium]